MPAKNPQKPIPVEPAKLPQNPSWETLKAHPQFREWHDSPFLQMMTAALRKNFPVSGATDPHVIIHHAGQLNGWLQALEAADSFCQQEKQGPGESTRIPYQTPKNHED